MFQCFLTCLKGILVFSTKYAYGSFKKGSNVRPNCLTYINNKTKLYLVNIFWCAPKYIRRVARTRQTRRHSPSRVAPTRQTRRHSPSRVARTRQTRRHALWQVFEKNVTRLDTFARVTRESRKFGASGHCLV
jgi:hypothetical protein